MKAKQSVEAQARSILQKVHNDACKKNHLPELGYSERAYDLVMKLVFQELSTLKAQVRKEIEGLRRTERESSDSEDVWGHYNQALTDCLSIPSLKEEE